MQALDNFKAQLKHQQEQFEASSSKSSSRSRSCSTYIGRIHNPDLSAIQTIRGCGSRTSAIRDAHSRPGPDFLEGGMKRSDLYSGQRVQSS